MTVTDSPPVLDTDRQTYDLSGWDLSELLPETSEEVIAQRLAELEAAVARFEAVRAELVEGMDRGRFLEIVDQYEGLHELFDRITGYAGLWFSEDTQSRAAQGFMNRVEQAVTGYYNRVLFFELWWKSLDDDEAAELLPDAVSDPAAIDPGAGSLDPATLRAADHRHFLLDVRRSKPFTLSETSEQIVNIKDANGIGALMTLYSMLTNRLEFQLEVDGEALELTRDGLMSYAFSRNPDLRRDTYRELYRVYENEATVLGQIYSNRVRDWHGEFVELRGYPSPISVRNVANDVPDEAVDVLLQVCAENAPLFRRYFELKAHWLGLDKLRRYDIYAPLAGSEREIPYAEAVESVLGTFSRFSPLLSNLADRVFREGHIDSEVRRGKRGGAFCSTVGPRYTPWVLINYTGRVRDVATLAHELGHAVHSMLAEDHTPLTQHPSLPLAETASVFAEMLMTDRLLSEESDPLARRELLVASVDDVYATVMRQAYFVRFELDAHRAILEGRSVDQVSELYMENLRDQFGDSVELADEFQYEWLSIPHIYNTPFYCYAYSFGQLLVLALYRRYQEEGEAFKPGYLKLLAYGGAARPQEILREVGIDITDPVFWRGGFEVVESRIEELEALGVQGGAVAGQ